MKTIMIPKPPKICTNILSGEATILPIKSAPKETPFKVKLYCTKNDKFGRQLYRAKNNGGYIFIDDRSHNAFDELLSGKIIGEFICDKVVKYEDIELSYFEFARVANDIDKYQIEKSTCLTLKEMHAYGEGKDLYFLHITALKIYEKPREINEFRVPCEHWHGGWSSCDNYCGIASNGECHDGNRPITRPPQSWMHVEEEV